MHILIYAYTHIRIYAQIYSGCTEKAEFVKKLQETEHLEM